MMITYGLILNLLFKIIHFVHANEHGMRFANTTEIQFHEVKNKEEIPREVQTEKPDITGMTESVTRVLQEVGASIGELASQKLAFRFGVWLQIYYLPVALMLGLIGNTLSVIVMCRGQNRRISCGVYMAALAVSDNILLLNVIYLHVLSHHLRSLGIWTSPVSHTECKIACFITMVTSTGGVVLVMCMTGDRFLAVRYPLKSALWCTTKRAKITIAAVTIAMLIYNIPYIVYSKVIGDGKVCAAMIIKTPFSGFYSWFNLSLNSVVPFVVLLTLNGLIISTIRGRSKKFPAANQHQGKISTASTQDAATGSGKTESRERNLTVMLLLVSFTLLVLTIPMYIRMMVSQFINATSSAETYATYMLMYHISNKLFYTNNCCNFYLYCMGGTKFREDLRNLFHLGCQ